MNGINSVKNYKYSFLVKKTKNLKILKKAKKSALGPSFMHTIMSMIIQVQW